MKFRILILAASVTIVLAAAAATHSTVAVDRALGGTVPANANPTLSISLENESPSPTPRGWVTSYGVYGGETSPQGIDCGDTCSAQFPAGTIVTLWPITFEGSRLVRWEDDNGNTPAACPRICRVELTTSTHLTAVFASGSDPVDFKTTFTVSKSGSGGGTVQSRPPGIQCGTSCVATYPTNVNVTLTVTPDSSSTFSGWTGPCAGVGTAESCLVTVGPAIGTSASFDHKTAPTPPSPVVPQPPVTSQPPVVPPRPVTPEPPVEGSNAAPGEDRSPGTTEIPAGSQAGSSSSTEPGSQRPAKRTIATGRVVVHVKGANRVRTISLAMRLGIDARSTVRLVRRGKPVFTTKSSVHQGQNTVRVSVPRSVRAGHYRLVLLLRGPSGVSQRLTWPVVV